MTILTIKFCDGDSWESYRKKKWQLSIDILMESTAFQGNNTSTCYRVNECLVHYSIGVSECGPFNLSFACSYLRDMRYDLNVSVLDVTVIISASY
jgi:hypothetical protein